MSFEPEEPPAESGSGAEADPGRRGGAARRFARAARPSRRFDQLPIRTRLAAVSTLSTFVILCGFAVVVGGLAAQRIREDWQHQLKADGQAYVNQLVDALAEHRIGTTQNGILTIPLGPAPAGHAIRIIGQNGAVVGGTEHASSRLALGAPPSPNRLNFASNSTEVVNGYEVANITGLVENVDNSPFQRLVVQYAQQLSQIDSTVNRVRLLLALGVLGGTLLAFFAGTMIARRAMEPIARLTTTAGEIARTRDPRSQVPLPDTDDEVAELARTLDEMLHALDSARSETESALANQRQFVADASHELRTPLTSVMANLELLADTLHGEQGEAARSALRSSRRMRRLVADLLLLARNDAGRDAAHHPVDLGKLVVEAAAELGPVMAEHELVLDAQPAPVSGVRDDLLRLAINLIENALRHTPPGTRVTVHTGTVGGRAAELVVEDDGPGVPPEIAPRLFERFVRGRGDRSGSSGLGLAIVRVVARAHGGDVQLQEPASGTGARFVVRLPLLIAPAEQDGAVDGILDGARTGVVNGAGTSVVNGAARVPAGGAAYTAASTPPPRDS